MDIFTHRAEELTGKRAPLSERMRPRNLDEIVGQEHILAPGRLLRQAILADSLTSVILYGPPGTGKTTLARVIAATSKKAFEQLSAVTAKVGDIRQVVERARERLGMAGQGTILFLDEIHRFNKAQQDALLPHVETGLLVLIGATTENPYFEVNSPLLSRSGLFRLEPLAPADLRTLLERALEDEERGLGKLKVILSEEVLNHFVEAAGGDARSALNSLELAAMATPADEGGQRQILPAIAQEATGRRLSYDRDGDQHFDTVSAYIKSMRGSDPDAALYWLARMIRAGEDPVYIARRLVICAAEDVGNADPQALVVAMAAADAARFIGWPEASLPLAQATTYVACAPKGNAVTQGIAAALADVDLGQFAGVPKHLRDASYPGARQLGHGQGYKYPHNFPGHYIEQEYLPENLRGKRYYLPSASGYERRHRERLEHWRGEKGETEHE